MLLYIANLPFDIRIARIRKLIADECHLYDVILDNLINDNFGKRITVGLVDHEQASLVMAKINGYFLDGRKLQVEMVQKKNPNLSLSSVMKPFQQLPQPLLNNYNMMFPQPVHSNVTNTFNAMPFYMAQQSFGNTERQLAPQTAPFPSFNKQNAGNWYAMNFGSQQYGMSSTPQIAQSVQNVVTNENVQKRDHDSEACGNPEKRLRGDADGGISSYSSEHATAGKEDPRLLDPSRQSHDRSDDRYDDRDGSRDGRSNSRDGRSNSRNDRRQSRGGRNNRDNRQSSHDGRNTSRDDRYNSRFYRHNSRDDRHNSRDDSHYNRDDRHNSRDDRYYNCDDHQDNRDDRYHRRGDHTDNSRRQYGSHSLDNRSFDAERSTFDSGNRDNSRRVVWERSPFKQDQKSLGAAGPPIKPLLPYLANTSSPQSKPQENFNNPRQSFNASQPIFNKSMQITNKPQQKQQQPFNNQQNLNKPQSSGNTQPSFNKNQQNLNKPQQKIDNPSVKHPLTKKEVKIIQFSSLTAIHSDLVASTKATVPARAKLKGLCAFRVKDIIRQHGCVNVQEVRDYYSRRYPLKDDSEVQTILRNYSHVQQPGSKSTVTQKVPQRQMNAQKASKTTGASKPGTQPNGAPPALNPVPAAQKLPKYPNDNKKVYRELKKTEQLEAQDGFVYDADEKYLRAIDHELMRMRELAVNACKEGSNENTEKIRQEILKNGIDKFLKAVKLHVTKRLVRNFVGTARIHFAYKPPKRPPLEAFLKGFGVVSLKKSDRSKFFVATFNNSDGYDRLLALGAANIDGIDVTIKPLNILGKPAKKDVVEKYQTNMIKMAEKFKMTSKQQMIQQMKQNPQPHEPSSDDVEFIDNQTDEVVEIEDDSVVDFSEDVIEVDAPESDANNKPKSDANDEPKSDANYEPKSDANDALKSDANDEPKSDANNEPKSDPNDEPKSDANDEPKSDANDEPKCDANDAPKSDDNDAPKTDVNAAPKTDANEQESGMQQEPQISEQDPKIDSNQESEIIQIEESVDPAQGDDDEVCTVKESGVTITNEELKSDILSAIDDDDLEDF